MGKAGGGGRVKGERAAGKRLQWSGVWGGVMVAQTRGG